MKVKVSSYTAPNAVLTSFTWEIEVLRAKTYNIIKKYSGNNAPTLAAGAITVSSWVSSNGYPTNFMKKDIPVYMTTTITTQTAIPSTGTIDIDFADSLSQDATKGGCYMVH